MRIVELLHMLGLPEVLVEDARQSAPEADEVGATFPGVDAVDEGEHRLVETVVVLDANLDLDLVSRAAEVDRVGVEDRLVFVQDRRQT